MDRLPAHLEANAIMRRVESAGGFAVLLRKGDPDRGALLLFVRERGGFHSVLERVLGADFRYRWALADLPQSEGSVELEQFVVQRTQFDADSWLIELDVADAERFIAETIASA